MYKNLFHFLLPCLMLTGIVGGNNLIVDDNLHKLTLEEQEVIVKNLMQRHPCQISTSKPLLTEDDAAWRELDMDLLIQKLDYTSSVAGKNRFKELMKPVPSIDEIEKRRAVFEELLTSKDYCDVIEKLINDYHERERLLLTFFEPRNAFYEQLKASALVTEPEPVQGRVYGMPYLFRYQQFSPLPAIVISFLMQSKVAHTMIMAWRRDRSTGNAAAVGSALGPLSLTPLSIYGSYIYILQVNAVVRTLHGLMINLASIINDAEQLEQSMLKCDSVQVAFSQWYGYLTPESNDYCKELHELTQLLKNSTFTGQPSANIGTSLSEVFKAYEYLTVCKEKLVPLIHAYGIADAYMSVVKLYRDYQHKNRSLVWVVLSKDELPWCSLEDIYNPIIPHEKSVINSFELGGCARGRHMMLTGPHGCGKTTSMKSIAYAYTMGQSIGLAPASSATITPLTKIATYLNITDNLAQGMSSFMAEKTRMKELLAIAEQLSPTDRCLMLVDEPYAKTLQVVGEERVYKFAKEIYNIPQLMMLLASHFEKPAMLEQETQGIIENYQPELLEPTPGNFVRTFKILKGKATWWFEDSKRRDDFIDWLGEPSAAAAA
jgi:DNA mismatch repair ATPase MutS